MTAGTMQEEGEGFLRRWARRKTEVKQGIEPVPEPAPLVAPLAAPVVAEAAPGLQPAAEPQPVRLPTMDDVAQLTTDSDFSAFVARGVDQAVRRSALKKLFADPHFNVLDRLDMYMDDYNQPSPMPDGMLAALKHSKSLFAGLAKDDETEPADQADAAVAASASAVAPAAVAVSAAASAPAAGDHPDEAPAARRQPDTTTRSTIPPEQETP